REAPFPVLLVLCARDEALVERRAEDAMLNGLVRRAETVTIDVGPLPVDRRSELVRELLGLDAALAARVEEKTAGNPLFAVQLVGDWVHRRWLVPGPDGFELVPDARVEIPDDLHGVWAARVTRLLAARAPEEAVALEVAAMLGNEVDGEEWLAACE